MVCTTKFGALIEPINIVLFILDQFAVLEESPTRNRKPIKMSESRKTVIKIVQND